VRSLYRWTPGLHGGGVCAGGTKTRFWQVEGPMAKILYATSFGSDDPTRATIPFIAATGAIEAGHEPEIALLGEATYLVKTGMAEQIQGVGFPPLKQLFSNLIEHRVSRLRVRAVREGPWGLRGRTQEHRCTVHQPQGVRRGDGGRRPGCDRLNAEAATSSATRAARRRLDLSDEGGARFEAYTAKLAAPRRSW
jgi:hypothetical protein